MTGAFIYYSMTHLISVHEVSDICHIDTSVARLRELLVFVFKPGATSGFFLFEWTLIRSTRVREHIGRVCSQSVK